MMKELVIEAKTENLPEVLAFVEGALEEAECPFDVQTQVAIAVEEIYVNIAHYAYNPETGNAVIRIQIGDEVYIEFEDNGVPYNPLENETPDITAGAEEREIGGLGIHMVKTMMDAVEYKHDGNKNLLIIKKSLMK